MQDFLPDVNELNINEDVKEVQKKSLNKKQVFRLMVVVVLALLIFMGGLVNFLEKKDKVIVEEERESLSERAKLIEKKPGQMIWLFYLDEDNDSVFGYKEKVFSGVSVSIRKSGEVQILRTVPANVLGQVIIDDLAEGEYEVSFDNYAKDSIDEGEFSFPGMYQVGQGELKEFLPSLWQKIVLDSEGYYSKIGMVEYNPESLLVFEVSDKILFYDSDLARLAGWSNSKLQGVSLKVDKLYFLKDDDLKEFDIKTRIVKLAMDWVYEVGEYRLSADGKTIVYKQGDEFKYKSKTCGEGSVLVDGYRLELKDMLVDFLNSNVLVVAGKVFEGDYKVYQVVCSDGDMVAREVVDSEVSSLAYLNDKTIFYSDSSGSYFYDLVEKSKVRYTALGNGVKAIFSFDKKYIGAMVNGKLMVVDYLAVKASGVEKHYVIDIATPGSKQPAYRRGRVPPRGVNQFVGDELFINNGSEILRIKLKGSGLWEIGERIELKDVVVDKVLGEIEF
ncbi:hypothetical protein KKB06_03225 [Patescibacteria group bacterium]|nr:hypothetical protein [Patescibacteria group bacterium]